MCLRLHAGIASMQVQLGRYAVLDSTGSTPCFNAGQEVHMAIHWSVWLRILSIPYSVSGPTAGLIVPHGATSTCLRGQPQCSFLMGYLPRMQACLCDICGSRSRMFTSWYPYVTVCPCHKCCSTDYSQSSVAGIASHPRCRFQLAAEHLSVEYATSSIQDTLSNCSVWICK